jgi:hypothetical protein
MISVLKYCSFYIVTCKLYRKNIFHIEAVSFDETCSYVFCQIIDYKLYL